MLTVTGTPILERMKRHHRLNDEAVVGTHRTGCQITGTKTAGNDRIVFGVATTDSVDLDREVVLPDGADRAYLDRNKAVFADHNYESLSHIGTIRNIWREGNGWKYSVNLFHGLRHPLADDMYAKAQQGGIGASIGFQALEWGKPTVEEAKRYPRAKTIIRKWAWIELSLTAMPANLDCQGEAWMPGEKSANVFGAIVAKARSDKGTAVRLGLVMDEPARTKKIVFLN